ncbi:MAG: hypothetical protein OXI53_04145 [Nitrospira sp.]|nr:hypothetical protein [Nitrospira sp.]
MSECICDQGCEGFRYALPNGEAQKNCPVSTKQSKPKAKQGKVESKSSAPRTFYEQNATYVEVQSPQELSGINKSGRYIWKFARFKGNSRLGRFYEIPQIFHKKVLLEAEVRLKQGKDTTGWDCDTISRVVDLKYKNAYVVSCDNYQNHFKYTIANRKFSICQADGKNAKGSCFK